MSYHRNKSLAVRGPERRGDDPFSASTALAHHRNGFDDFDKMANKMMKGFGFPSMGGKNQSHLEVRIWI